MYVFIAIIFIAELIITGWLIGLFLMIDKRLLAFGNVLIKNLSTTVVILKETTHLLNIAQDLIEKSTGYISRKKRAFIGKIINLVIVYLLLFVFKLKFKRAASMLQYFLIIKDLWTSIPG